MAETHILNPQQRYWAAISDNPNPDYKTPRDTGANSLVSRTRLAGWDQRDNGNAGYSFSMNFIDRPWSTMLRLKSFYEIGKRGYFTYIDYDAGSRNHVGSFTAPPRFVQNQNGKWSCQNLTFEEMPQARMLSYPADFTNWSANVNVLDDRLRLSPAYRGAWTLRQNPSLISPAVTDPTSYQLWSAAPAAADYAQIQYTGWGFQAAWNVNAVGGQCDVYLDGQLIVDGLDLFSGGCTASHGYTFINPLLPYVSLSIPQTAAATVAHSFVTNTVTVQLTGVPLDAHRVKVVARATKNVSSAGYEVTFPNVQVIV